MKQIKFKKLKIWYKNNFELIIPFIIGVLIFITSLIFVMYFKKISLNITNFFSDMAMVEIYAGLTGFLLTAYAILFAIVPMMNKEIIESNVYHRINLLFVHALILNISLIIFTSIAYFTNGKYILLTIILLSSFMSLITYLFLILAVLYKLFKLQKKEMLS